jgi:hypothetical protein
MTDCWLARFAPEVPCDGPEDPVHLLPKQRIKREVSHDQRIVWHPATFVRACRRHHGMLDVERTLRIPRSEAITEASPRSPRPRLAREFGLEWSLDRDYGPLGSGDG